MRTGQRGLIATALILAIGCSDQSDLTKPDATPTNRVEARMAFGSCFEWGYVEFQPGDFDEICVVGGLTVITTDGSEERFVVEGEQAHARSFAWSPDGRKIAFASFRPYNCGGRILCSSEIYAMSADGSEITRLTNTMHARIHAPTWSPDGRRIAFAADYSADGPVSRLYVMDADGTNIVSLGSLYGAAPAWSPDGRQLAFSAGGDGDFVGIHVADADGSNPVRLTTDSANEFQPSWSPASDRIAFVRRWIDPEGRPGCQVFVMNADGSNPVQLTQDPWCAHSPAWSPDGATISFTGQAGARHGIIFMNSDGTEATLFRSNVWSRVAWTPMP